MKTRHLLADMGNSALKLGWLRPADTKRRWTWYEDDWKLQQLPPESIDWTIACVNPARLRQLRLALRRTRPGDRVRELRLTDVPMKLAVDEPSRLGIDRCLAAWRAWNLCGHRGPVAIVDAGTAVTVDAVDAHGVFQGGVIFAGLHASRGALASQTGALPRLEPQLPPSRRAPFRYLPVLGKSTREAIELGSLYSLAGGIIQTLERLQSEMGRIRHLVATGGDLPWVLSQLPGRVRHEPDLVLQAIGDVVHLGT